MMMAALMRKRLVRGRGDRLCSAVWISLLAVAGWAFSVDAAAALYMQPGKDMAFAVTGFIEKATLDPEGTDPITGTLAGGSVDVNGLHIVIPKNTKVLMPGRFLTWQQLWAKAPLPWGLGGNGKTGLALADRDSTNAPPPVTYEITVQGNCIPNLSNHPKLDPDPAKCTYVAGLVSIAQHSLTMGQGIINYIDYANATLHVGGKLGAKASTDALVQINDPAISLPSGKMGGRFSKGQSPDERFATDQDNAAIRAETGYPMCIPRVDPPAPIALVNYPPGLFTGNLPVESDPLCPQINRPMDTLNPTIPMTSFTLGLMDNPSPALLAVAVPALAHTLGQPDQQAPFMVGDFISYAGTRQLDTDGKATGCSSAPCTYISAHEIVDNVGIYTSPGASPAYVVAEETLLGIGGTPINFPAAIPQEATGRMKVVGTFTDPTRYVDVYAVHTDPCTGDESLNWLQLWLNGRLTPWGRWLTVDKTCATVGAASCGAPPSREWRIRYSDVPLGSDLVVANGLKANQYQIPVGEFIFPENTVFGDPNLLVIPNNFQDMPFLMNGSGPLDGPGGTGPIVGALDPFPMTNSIPGLNPPVQNTIACTPQQQPPVASAGISQTVASGATVTLDASGTITNGLAVSYVWTQMAGPIIPGFPTVGSTSPSASFKAPTVNFGAAPVALSFMVTATNSAGLSSSATVSINVTAAPQPPDTVIITTAKYTVKSSQLSVTATSSSSKPNCNAALTMLLDTGFTAAMSCKASLVGGLATYTFSSKPVTRPNYCTVKSSLGGVSTVVVP